MPVKIEVEKDVDVKQGVSKKTGNEYRMIIQKAWLHGAAKHPLLFELAHFEDDDVLEPGEYLVKPKYDVYNGRLDIRPEFVPVPSGSKG